MPLFPARPELIAHRGAKLELRENTLPAFVRAVERGAEGIELDVHATADGIVVVHHDPVLGSLVAPADGAGRAIHSLTAAELSTYRFPDGSGIPTLREVLDELAAAATIYVEVKGVGIEALVAQVIAPFADRVAVHAFDHRVPSRVVATLPGTPTGILQASYLIDPVAAMAAAGSRDLWQYWELIDAPLVDVVHAAGGRVIAWTANDPDVIRTLAAWGVDGICSDDLRVVRAALGE